MRIPILRALASFRCAFVLAPVACAGPDAHGTDAKTTSEVSSVSGTGDSTKGDSSTTDVSTTHGPITVDVTSGSTSHDDTSVGASTTSTGGETTVDPTETDGENPFRVGIALKSLCSPDLSSLCGVTPDDKMVCWGATNYPSYQVPPGKVKAVSPHCFIAVLENGELHRLMNVPLLPLSLPKGPFVLAGGEYPYGCAMAANYEMTCWVANGYQKIEEPPPGPYVWLDDSREGNCQMCGIRGDGSLACWKKPVMGGWDSNCDGLDWVGVAPGTYTKFMDSNFHSVRLMNNMGQLVWFEPEFGGSIYVEPLFESGGFVEARVLVGLRQSGDLLYFEKGMGDGVPILPGAYTTFRGDQNGGCAIRQSDSRVVCWGEGEYGQFDPPTE